MPERIFLTYTNAGEVPYLNNPLGHPVVLNYIDAHGFHRTLEGVPERPSQSSFGKLVGLVREEVLSDGMHNTDSPFGRIRVYPEQKDKTDTSLNQPHTMIAQGEDLSPQWALMRDFGDEVNSTGYEYRPVSQNSNSFAGGALQRARLYGAGSRFATLIFSKAMLFFAVALVSCFAQMSSARADSASCLAKASAFITELDALLEKGSEDKPQLSSDPYRDLAERYFPLRDCDAGALMDVARRSQFIRSIQYNPRANEYHVMIVKDPLGAWFSYLVSEKKSEAAGAGFVRKP